MTIFTIIVTLHLEQNNRVIVVQIPLIASNTKIHSAYDRNKPVNKKSAWFEIQACSEFKLISGNVNNQWREPNQKFFITKMYGKYGIRA